jgi:hypothetical protein
MCDTTQVHFELSDANGEKVTKDQNLGDNISVDLPEALPAFANVTFGDGSSVQFTVPGKDRLSYSVNENGVYSLSNDGGLSVANVLLSLGPKITAGYVLEIQFCPD